LDPHAVFTQFVLLCTGICNAKITGDRPGFMLLSQVFAGIIAYCPYANVYWSQVGQSTESRQYQDRDRQNETYSVPVLSCNAKGTSCYRGTNFQFRSFISYYIIYIAAEATDIYSFASWQNRHFFLGGGGSSALAPYTGSDPYSAWMKYVVCHHLYIP